MSDKSSTRSVYDKAYKAKKKQRAINLLGGKCVNCNTLERLQFDHIKNDREGSKKTITYMLNTTSWEKVMEELKKCQLLCFSCHIKKSNSERGRTGLHLHGTMTKYRADKCRCADCKRVHSLYMKNWHNRHKESTMVIL